MSDPDLPPSTPPPTVPPPTPPTTPPTNPPPGPGAPPEEPPLLGEVPGGDVRSADVPVDDGLGEDIRSDVPGATPYGAGAAGTPYRAADDSGPPPGAGPGPTYGTQPAYGAQPGYGTGAQAPRQSLSLTSFIVGLASLVFCWVPGLGFLGAIAAVVIGFIAKGREPQAPNWMWLVGIISGFAAILLSLLILIPIILLLAFGTAITTNVPIPSY